MIERRPFSELLERHAPRAEFREWFRAFSEPRGLSATGWMELVPPVAQAVIDLQWMPESDRGIVTGCILDFVRRAFTLWSPADPVAAREAVNDFVSWVESLSDDAVVRFCWDLLSYDRTHTPDPV